MLLELVLFFFFCWFLIHIFCWSEQAISHQTTGPDLLIQLSSQINKLPGVGAREMTPNQLEYSKNHDLALPEQVLISLRINKFSLRGIKQT